MEPKLPSESRTIILALIQIAIGFLGAVAPTIEFIQEFARDNPVDWSDAATVIPWLLLLIKGLVDIWLRFATKTPIVWNK